MEACKTPYSTVSELDYHKFCLIIGQSKLHVGIQSQEEGKYTLSLLWKEWQSHMAKGVNVGRTAVASNAIYSTSLLALPTGSIGFVSAIASSRYPH